jgi:peptidyl-prolyl cis-trans isomerase SurA
MSFITKNSRLLLFIPTSFLLAYTPSPQIIEDSSITVEWLALRAQQVDKVIASVDDQPILESELAAAYQIYQSQKRSHKTPDTCALLDHLIVHKLLLNTAHKRAIVIKREEIESYLNYRMEAILKEVGSQQALEKYLGKPITIIKHELRKSIKEQLIDERVRNSIVEDVAVSPMEVNSFFRQLASSKIPFSPARVEAYMLVRYPMIAPDEKKSLIDQLENLKSRVKAGEDFAALAQLYSQDPVSAANGGVLGFYKIGTLEPAYEKAALALLPGEISAPIETKYGFHLIQLVERRTGGMYNSRHILLRSAASVPGLETIKVMLNNIRDEVISKKMTFTEAVKTYSQDIDTAKKGGLITDGPAGIQMAVDQLPPDLFFLLDALKPGEITRPVIFTNPAGVQGVRLVYLKAKVDSHQATLEQDYEHIQKLALEAKKQKAFEDWLTKAKQQAIIQIDMAYQFFKQ